jgi:hypothetical protein
MTKEQTLEAACRKYRTFLIGSKIVDGDVNAVYEAMDNWAEAESVAFAEWVDGNNYEVVMLNKVLHFYTPGKEPMYTTPEIYQLYIQSKQIQ